MNIDSDDFEVSYNTVQYVMDLLDTSDDEQETKRKGSWPSRRTNLERDFDVADAGLDSAYLMIHCTTHIHFAVATTYLDSFTTVYMMLLSAARIT